MGVLDFFDDDVSDRADNLFGGGVFDDVDELFRSFDVPAVPFSVVVQAKTFLCADCHSVRVGLAVDDASALVAPAVVLAGGTSVVFEVRTLPPGARRLEVWAEDAASLVDARVVSLDRGRQIQDGQGDENKPPAPPSSTTIAVVVGGLALVAGLAAFGGRR